MYSSMRSGILWAGFIYPTTATFIMTAKDKIDRFIGEIPNLNIINKSPTYLFSENPGINNAYWQGYIHAKIELRDKLYKKENISETPTNPLNSWTPEFNTNLFGKDLYEN